MRGISWLTEELSAYHVVTYLFIQPVISFSDCLRKPLEHTSTKLCLVPASCCSGSEAGFLTKLTYLVSVKACGWTCVWRRNGTCTRGLSVRISRTFRSTRHHSFGFSHLRPATGVRDLSVCRHSALVPQIRSWIVLSTSLSIHNSLIILSTRDSSVSIVTTLRTGVQRIVFRCVKFSVTVRMYWILLIMCDFVTEVMNMFKKCCLSSRGSGTVVIYFCMHAEGSW
jgi:hypothetical protein